MSLTIAFVVLLHIMLFTFNMNYCGNTLVETALYQNAKVYGMVVLSLKSIVVVMNNY